VDGADEVGGERAAERVRVTRAVDVDRELTEEMHTVEEDEDAEEEAVAVKDEATEPAASAESAGDDVRALFLRVDLALPAEVEEWRCSAVVFIREATTAEWRRVRKEDWAALSDNDKPPAAVLPEELARTAANDADRLSERGAPPL
jgi:hypothetical protein